MLNEHVDDFIHLHSTFLCRYVCKGRRQAVHLIIEKECLCVHILHASVNSVFIDKRH